MVRLPPLVVRRISLSPERMIMVQGDFSITTLYLAVVATSSLGESLTAKGVPAKEGPVIVVKRKNKTHFGKDLCIVNTSLFENGTPGQQMQKHLQRTETNCDIRRNLKQEVCFFYGRSWEANDKCRC
jgi:hypothetical protein